MSACQSHCGAKQSTPADVRTFIPSQTWLWAPSSMAFLKNLSAYTDRVLEPADQNFAQQMKAALQQRIGLDIFATDPLSQTGIHPAGGFAGYTRDDEPVLVLALHDARKFSDWLVHYAKEMGLAQQSEAYQVADLTCTKLGVPFGDALATAIAWCIDPNAGKTVAHLCSDPEILEDHLKSVKSASSSASSTDQTDINGQAESSTLQIKYQTPFPIDKNPEAKYHVVDITFGNKGFVVTMPFSHPIAQTDVQTWTIHPTKDPESLMHIEGTILNPQWLRVLRTIRLPGLNIRNLERALQRQQPTGLWSSLTQTNVLSGRFFIDTYNSDSAKPLAFQTIQSGRAWTDLSFQIVLGLQPGSDTQQNIHALLNRLSDDYPLFNSQSAEQKRPAPQTNPKTLYYYLDSQKVVLSDQRARAASHATSQPSPPSPSQTKQSKLLDAHLDIDRLSNRFDTDGLPDIVRNLVSVIAALNNLSIEMTEEGSLNATLTIQQRFQTVTATP